MAQVRLLSPWTDDNGKPHAAGEVVNVDDATYDQLRADGKASATSEEDAAAKRASEGSYGARTGRTEAGGTDQPTPAPAPPPEEKKK